jgi:hypothetical protein
MGVLMASNPPNVSGLFPPPERNDCQKAIGRALLRIRSMGWSRESLGRLIGVCADTIDNATNEKGMMGFETVAALLFHFPDETAPVLALWINHATAPLTVADRIARMSADLRTIEREIAA